MSLDKMMTDFKKESRVNNVREEKRSKNDSPMHCTATGCNLKAAFPCGETHAFCSFHDGQLWSDWEDISARINQHWDLFMAWRRLDKLCWYDFEQNKQSYMRGSIPELCYQEGEGFVTYKSRFWDYVKRLIVEG